MLARQRVVRATEIQTVRTLVLLLIAIVAKSAVERDLFGAFVNEKKNNGMSVAV